MKRNKRAPRANRMRTPADRRVALQEFALMRRMIADGPTLQQMADALSALEQPRLARQAVLPLSPHPVRKEEARSCAMRVGDAATRQTASMTAAGSRVLPGGGERGFDDRVFRVDSGSRDY